MGPASGTSELLMVRPVTRPSLKPHFCCHVLSINLRSDGLHAAQEHLISYHSRFSCLLTSLSLHSCKNLRKAASFLCGFGI